MKMKKITLLLILAIMISLSVVTVSSKITYSSIPASYCGDGYINTLIVDGHPVEECDTTAPNPLNGKDCTNLTDSLGTPFTGGILRCYPPLLPGYAGLECKFDKSGCLSTNFCNRQQINSINDQCCRDSSPEYVCGRNPAPDTTFKECCMGVCAHEYLGVYSASIPAAKYTICCTDSPVPGSPGYICQPGQFCNHGVCAGSATVIKGMNTSCLYLVRNKNEPYTKSGIAYEFLPHDSTLNVDSIIHFRVEGNENDYEAHYLKDLSDISECNYTVLSSNTQTIQPDILNNTFLTDDLEWIIPPNAFSVPTERTIRKLNLICDEMTLAEIIGSIKSTSNSDNFKLVIGQTASSEDNIAAIDIAGFLKIGQTIYDEPLPTKDNLFVIGGPCVNREAADLLGLTFGPTTSCGVASTIPENKGIIRALHNNGKTQILVAGWDANQTRIAAQAIVNLYQQMQSGYITTYGTSLTDIHIQ